MRRIAILMLLVALASPALVSAQGDPAITSAEPFKLGTFEIAGDQRIGIVLQDKLVVDLSAANRALERNPAYPRMPMPADMVALIGQYQYGMKTRLYEIVNDIVAQRRLTATPRPGYIYDLSQVDTLRAAHAGQDAQRGGELLQPRGRDRDGRRAEKGGSRAPGQARCAVLVLQVDKRRGCR